MKKLGILLLSIFINIAFSNAQELKKIWKSAVLMDWSSEFMYQFEDDKLYFIIEYNEDGTPNKNEEDVLKIYKIVPESDEVYGKIIARPLNDEGMDYYLILYFKNLEKDKVEILNPLSLMMSFVKTPDAPQTVEEAEAYIPSGEEKSQMVFIKYYSEEFYVELQERPVFPENDRTAFFNIIDGGTEKLKANTEVDISKLGVEFLMMNYFVETIIEEGYGISVESLNNFKQTGDEMNQVEDPEFKERIEKIKQIAEE